MHKVLLIGAGSICRTHIDAFEGLHGRAKVVGIVARHQESAQKAIDNADLDAKAYTDYILRRVRQAKVQLRHRIGHDPTGYPQGNHRLRAGAWLPCYGRKADGPLAAGM